MPIATLRRGGVAVLLCLASCLGTNGSLVTTLDDLTSETQREGLTSINQNRIASVSGSLAHEAPGSVMRYKNDRAASTAFGLTEGKTHILTKTVEPPDGYLAKVAEVKLAIQIAQDSAAKVVELRLEKLKAEAEVRRALEADDGSVTQARQALGQVKTKLDQADADFSGKLLTARKKLDTPGIIVFRWATTDESSFSLRAVVGLDASSSEQSSGFAIVAGWREATLVVGEDITDAFDSLNLDRHFDWGYHLVWGFVPWFFSVREDPHVRLTTRVGQVKALAYLQDVQSSASLYAKIEASLDDLQNLDDAVKQLEQIEIEMTLNRVASLSSEGFLQAPEWTTTEDGGADGAFKSMRALRKTESGWHTVFAVDTDFADLVRMFD
ncbi:MAG: hypothetical protein AAF682_04910 [Planctomycetota bacterium]